MKRQTRHKWRRVDGILLLDKPAGITSNSALQKARRLYLAEKAGHTGILDPLATGLLPVCFGQATKISSLMLDASKRYRATVRLGIRTSSGDCEGITVETRALQSLRRGDVESVIPKLLGEIDQIPPMYSAIKQDGTHLYELARQGIEVDRAPRRVVIQELQVIDVSELGFEFEVLCSKGTYVRTLAEDWAALLGQVGHLTALRRLETGPFKATDMVSEERLRAVGNEFEALDSLLKPLIAALPGWTTLAVDRMDAIRLRRGLECGPYPDTQPGTVIVVDAENTVLFMAEVDQHLRLWPKRWLGPDSAVS